MFNIIYKSEKLFVYEDLEMKRLFLTQTNTRSGFIRFEKLGDMYKLEITLPKRHNTSCHSINDIEKIRQETNTIFYEVQNVYNTLIKNGYDVELYI